MRAAAGPGRLAVVAGVVAGCLIGLAAPSGAAGSTLPSDLAAVSCASSSACEAVGSADTGTSSQSRSIAERWDGTSWALQGTPAPPGSSVVYLVGVSCASASSCQAVGYRHDSAGVTVGLIERWNGTSWAVQTSPKVQGGGSFQLSAVSCPSAAHCEAVGYSATASGGDAALAEGWDGHSWTIQPVPDPSGTDVVRLGGVSCASATRCEAVGIAEEDAGGTVTLAERWDGTTWSTQATPNPATGNDAQLTSVSCVSAMSCTAAGLTATNSLVEVWDGTQWRLQANPTSSGAAALLDGVSCRSGVPCQAVGSRASGSGEEGSLAEGRHDGRWALETTSDPAGARSAGLGAVSCASSGVCEAVGSWVTSSGGSSTLAEVWTGTTWSLQSTPDPTTARG